MKFIELTYYKDTKRYGGGASGKTDKKFNLSVESIVRITEYKNSTKISLSTLEHIEVCETFDEIKQKIHFDYADNFYIGN